MRREEAKGTREEYFSRLTKTWNFFLGEEEKKKKKRDISPPPLPHRCAWEHPGEDIYIYKKIKK